jgi:hypothetical protein
MLRSILQLGIVTLPILLGGCVVVWDSSYQVQSETPEAMVIQYDTHFTDDGQIEKLVRKHCQTYGKTARLLSHDKNILNISTDHFICQNLPLNSVTAPQ